MPKYTELDLNNYIETHKIFTDLMSEELSQLLASGKFSIDKHILDTEGLFSEERKRALMISLANLLWKITLEEKDRKILSSSLKKNEGFIEAAGVSKDVISEDLLWKTHRILQYKYNTTKRKKKEE